MYISKRGDFFLETGPCYVLNARCSYILNKTNLNII